MEEARSLGRFVEAQDGVFDAVLGESRRGAKRSHWMWFIFPQLAALSRSTTAKFYGLGGVDEARAYLAHPVLGPRYVTCVSALQDLAVSDPVQVLGDVDAMKLRSSLTLFEAADRRLIFTAALDRWFGGIRDIATQQLLVSTSDEPKERSAERRPG
jgi:uncharacterized protein (DUF1810 family)